MTLPYFKMFTHLPTSAILISKCFFNPSFSYFSETARLIQLLFKKWLLSRLWLLLVKLIPLVMLLEAHRYVWCVCVYTYFPPFHMVLFLYTCSERYLIQDYDSLYSFLMKVGGAFLCQLRWWKLCLINAFPLHRCKKFSLRTQDVSYT